MISEGGRLTSEGRSFFFSAVKCQAGHDLHGILHVKGVPLPLSESQLPGFLTTGRLDLTSGFSFGDVTSSRISNRSPSGLLSRGFCEGAGAEVGALACARVVEDHRAAHSCDSCRSGPCRYANRAGRVS